MITLEYRWNRLLIDPYIVIKGLRYIYSKITKKKMKDKKNKTKTFKNTSQNSNRNSLQGCVEEMKIKVK